VLFSSTVRIKVRIRFSCLVGKLLCTRICATLGSNNVTDRVVNRNTNIRRMRYKMRSASYISSALRKTVTQADFFVAHRMHIVHGYGAGRQIAHAGARENVVLYDRISCH